MTVYGRTSGFLDNESRVAFTVVVKASGSYDAEREAEAACGGQFYPRDREAVGRPMVFRPMRGGEPLRRPGAE